MYLILILFILFISFIFVYFFIYKNKKILNGGNGCIFPSVYNKQKILIGHLTGNISDFRDLSNNYYCYNPIRIG